MKLRIKFTKTGAMKFIGHLDLMRMLQKIFRQVGIPIAYSEGFNPHQIFSIASPLSVGITSEGEYLDMKLFEDVNPNEMVEEINKTCPQGIKFISAVIIDDEEPAAMALVSAAKYRILQVEPIITAENIEGFANQHQIIITRKTKKGIMKEMDIKPGIKNLVIQDDKIIMTIGTGSTFNVKPDAVIEAVLAFINKEYDPFNFKIHREEIYHGDDQLKPLLVPVKPVF